MKRFLFAIAALVILSGCSAASVGIIGGADGPTAIKVENGSDSEQLECKNIRMVKIDEKLYYETGKTSMAEARCGTADGNFTKNADKFEVPQNNNESNFSESKSYQIGVTENTVEIPIENEWKIFEAINTNSDISKYKYCFILEGTLPNAASSSKYLVLANEMNITFADASYILFGSDLSKMKDIYVLPI